MGEPPRPLTVGVAGAPAPKPHERFAPLTEKQRALARNVGQGLSWANAAVKAGFSANSAMSYYQQDPRIQAAIRAEQARFEKVNDMDRKRVMDGFVEAIEMARIQSDPTAMIKGWTEVAKMCGYYAPETKKIEVSVSAKRLIDKLETMSDDELLRYAEKQAETIDFVENEPQKALVGPENDENG
jgi:phage terminase small subunit